MPPVFLSRTDRLLRGIKQPVAVANPAVGTDWSVTVPGGQQWRVVALTATYHASAAVVNRTPELQWTVSGIIVCRVHVPASWTASATWGLTGFIGNTFQHFSGTPVSDDLPLPDYYVGGGSTMGVATTGLDAGDQWSNIGLYVEQVFYTDGETHDERSPHA